MVRALQPHLPESSETRLWTTRGHWEAGPQDTEDSALRLQTCPPGEAGSPPTSSKRSSPNSSSSLRRFCSSTVTTHFRWLPWPRQLCPNRSPRSKAGREERERVRTGEWTAGAGGRIKAHARKRPNRILATRGSFSQTLAAIHGSYYTGETEARESKAVCPVTPQGGGGAVTSASYCFASLELSTPLCISRPDSPSLSGK